MSLGFDGHAVNDIYRDKYVVFMDILGFKELVCDADQRSEQRSKLLRILALLKHTATANPHCGLHLSQFSDCIILSADHSPAGLHDLLLSIDLIVSNLLQLDILLRGGIEVGGIHHDDDFVYGVGVNKAYKLECREPHDPCILVSDEVCSDMNASGFGHHIEFDRTKEPPQAFLHYLLQYATFNPLTPMPGMVVLDQPAARIMRLMSHRLRARSGDVLEKAQWFQAYWNRTVAPSGVFGRIEASQEDPLPLLPRAP
jgi:hypothetical protein